MEDMTLWMKTDRTVRNNNVSSQGHLKNTQSGGICFQGVFEKLEMPTQWQTQQAHRGEI